MKIGIISDTHDNIHAIKDAVRLLNFEGVTLLVHLGDYSSGFTADHFKQFNGKIIGIFGENDGDREKLKIVFSSIGADISGEFRTLDVEGKKIALIHGNYPDIVKSLIDSKNYDFVFYGHDHSPKITKTDWTIAVDPGDASGFVGEKRTLAILNLENKEAKITQF